MKKLFLFAALLMTGFAFYSCDDVVDNPVQDATAEWSYEVSVKFADFKFWFDPTDENTQITDGVTGEPYLYKAPQTIYVYNMENELLGSLTTSEEIDDLSKSYKFSGKLNGAIGESLMISTLSTADYAKQDGTLKSIVDNSLILENAVVPVRHYSEAANKVTTANAELQCNLAIARAWMGSLNAGDKLTFTDDVRTFEWTVNEDFDPTINSEVYIAVPTNGDPEMAYTATTESENGYTRGFTIGDEVNTLNPGEIKTFGMPGIPPIQFEDLGVDLTKWDAYQREVNDITGTTFFSQWINDDKSFLITQSGEKAVDANVRVRGNGGKNVAVTINNIRLAEGCYFEVSNGATFDITLIGENEFEKLNLNSPYTKNGDGTWKFNQLSLGGGTYWNGIENIPYAAEYTINEDIKLTYLSASNGAKLTIADKKAVDVINKDGGAISITNASFSIGKDATLHAESKAKNSTVISWQNSAINVGENANINVQGGKDGTALELYNQNNDATNKSYSVNIGKNANINLVGGPEGIFGTGMRIYNYLNTTTNVKLDEGAMINAVGVDRYGIQIDITDYSGNNWPGIVNITVAKNAKIAVEDTEAGQGFYLYMSQDNQAFNYDGEGAFEIKSKDNRAMNLSNYNNSVINFKGGTISAVSGANQPAIWCRNAFTIAPEIKSFKATKGTDATLYISQNGTEAELDDLVTTSANFDDKTEAGVRTITPKAE